MTERVILSRIEEDGSTTIHTEDEHGKRWEYRGCMFVGMTFPEEEDVTTVKMRFSVETPPRDVVEFIFEEKTS